MIPDLATAIVSKEPPRAAKCSSPTVVITAAASPELDIIFVASRAPPNPAYQKKFIEVIITITLAILRCPVIVNKSFTILITLMFFFWGVNSEIRRNVQ